jgi:hypothetical protein
VRWGRGKYLPSLLPEDKAAAAWAAQVVQVGDMGAATSKSGARSGGVQQTSMAAASRGDLALSET